MKTTTEKLYNIVDEVSDTEDVILEEGITLSQAEERLEWHLNSGANAYIQDA